MAVECKPRGIKKKKKDKASVSTTDWTTHKFSFQSQGGGSVGHLAATSAGEGDRGRGQEAAAVPIPGVLAAAKC